MQIGQYIKDSREKMQYVVLQVTLRAKLIGTGSKNLSELEKVINTQVSRAFDCTPFPPKQAEARVSVVETKCRQHSYLRASRYEVPGNA